MVTDRRACRPAQALIELAMGMFALALVMSALFTFAAYIMRSMEVQRSLRSRVGRSAVNSTGDFPISEIGSGSVDVEPLAAKYSVGDEKLKIKEKVALPGMTLVNDAQQSL